MKKSIKAALYSGLVFPGIGHFFLKRHIVGFALFLPTLFAATVFLNDVWHKAWSIVEKIERGEVPWDPDVIVSLVSATQDVPVSLSVKIAIYVMLGCWVIGMIDAYRLGSIEEKAGVARAE